MLARSDALGLASESSVAGRGVVPRSTAPCSAEIHRTRPKCTLRRAGGPSAARWLPCCSKSEPSLAYGGRLSMRGRPDQGSLLRIARHLNPGNVGVGEVCTGEISTG